MGCIDLTTDIYPFLILFARVTASPGAIFCALNYPDGLEGAPSQDWCGVCHMSSYLPKEAEGLVDATSTLKSIRNLADAVERGELDLSALVSFVRIAGSGEAPKFSVAKSLPLTMVQAIRANPDKPPRQIVYAGVVQGLWTEKDAENFEENEVAISERRKKAKAKRGVYMTRSRRPVARQRVDDGRFVPKVNLAAISRDGLCDGARQCLMLIMSLAGKNDELTTYTSSLATEMKRTTRTIRNYFVQLEEAGLISRRPGRQFNTVHITLSPDCRPDPYVEPLDMKAFKLARNSGNPALHLMAMSVVFASVDAHPESFSTSDRRKGISVFNQESNLMKSRLCDTLSITAGGRGNMALERNQLAPPTTHSKLLVDPRKPIENGKRPWRKQQWASPNGFRQVGARHGGTSAPALGVA